MAEKEDLVIGADGYFDLGGQRFVPVGANYWPGSCGVEQWQRWPVDEMQRDLDLVVSLGLNCVRFFLRWQDFEPQPGQYEPVMLERLRQFLAWCAERNLYAHPSLFVGWMSGGTFWPQWKGKRNLFADPFVAERAAAFARQAAAVIAPFHRHVLAIDQGNEICCLSDSPAASPQAVIDWCRTINEAICSVYPHCLILSGNEQAQILSDSGWRFGDQPGTDLYSMHGYPVPAWHSVGFDGMADPLCQSLLPFYTQVARAFGPVMVQEFGTIVTFGPRQQDSYLRAVLPACWEAGANGFLWWCLRDITAEVHPYLTQRFESTLGMVDAQGKVKPGLEYWLEFAHSLKERPAPAGEGKEIGLYWPRNYYPRGESAEPGQCPRPALAVAGHGQLFPAATGPHGARRARRPAVGSRPAHDRHPRGAAGPARGERPGCLGALRPHPDWHGPDPVNWGHEYIALLGARPVDYRANRPATIELFGDRWTLDAYPRNMRRELVPDRATTLAADQDGLPTVLTHHVGQGKVVYALPVVESSIANVADDRDARSRWQRWYRGMLQS